jgi:hypothetical protein
VFTVAHRAIHEAHKSDVLDRPISSAAHLNVFLSLVFMVEVLLVNGETPFKVLTELF